jgi:PEP-CTERM motif
MRKTTSTLCALAIAGIFQTISAQAQVIINDHFTTYTDDASLTASWARVTGTSTIISLAPDPDPGATHGQGINVTTAAGRLRSTFTGVTPTDLAPLVLSFSFYDSNGGTTSGRQYTELRNSASASGLFAAGLFNSVNTGVYAQARYQARNLDNGGWIQLDATRSVGWHTFEFDIRGTTVDLKVDGLVDAQFSNLSWGGGTSYDWFNLGSALTSNTGSGYDDVYLAVTPVPEPSTIALGVLGGLGLMIGVRRNHNRK